MKRRRRTIGYCRPCGQNVAHSRAFSNSTFDLLDAFSLRILRLFRIGPWYCNQCEKKSYYLKLKRHYVPTSRYHEEYGRRSVEKEEVAEEGFESFGNYLKSDRSLVMREKRANRFSQKYRDAAAMRVLTGKQSISQTRSEVEVSENDIIDWISDLVQRKDKKIAELTRALQQLQEQMPAELRPLLEFEEPAQPNVMEDHRDTIDGKILPK